MTADQELMLDSSPFIDTQRVVSLIERQIKLENRMRALRLQGKEVS